MWSWSPWDSISHSRANFHSDTPSSLALMSNPALTPHCRTHVFRGSITQSLGSPWNLLSNSHKEKTHTYPESHLGTGKNDTNSTHQDRSSSCRPEPRFLKYLKNMKAASKGAWASPERSLENTGRHRECSGSPGAARTEGKALPGTLGPWNGPMFNTPTLETYILSPAFPGHTGFGESKANASYKCGSCQHWTCCCLLPPASTSQFRGGWLRPRWPRGKCHGSQQLDWAAGEGGRTYIYTYTLPSPSN